MYPITYGENCGANWSDGKYQSSVCGRKKPVDALDRACGEHDCDFASGKNIRAANDKFIKAAREAGGWRGYLASALVQATRYGERRFRGYTPPTPPPLFTRHPIQGIKYGLSTGRTASEGYSHVLQPIFEETPTDFRMATERLSQSNSLSGGRTIIDDTMPAKKTSKSQPMIARPAMAPKKRPMAKGAVKAPQAAVVKKAFAPSAVGSVVQNQGPATSYLSGGSVRVRHRENIGELVTASSAFTVQPVFSINPGMAQTFPG